VFSFRHLCKGSAAGNETSGLPIKPAGKPAFSRD